MWGASGAVIAVPLGVYWSISAAGDALKVLTIDGNRVQMRGYTGGPIVITRANQPVTCRYVPFRVREHSVEVAFLEIQDAGRNTIKVWRYGWGRRTRTLFAALGSWLEAAEAEVSPEAGRFLDRIASGRLSPN
jgi:hypothetical protein